MDIKNNENKNNKSTIISWYLTFVCLSIPVFGWLYILILMFSKKQADKKNFARGYLLYKLTILIVSIALSYLIIKVSLPYVESLLAYMELL